MTKLMFCGDCGDLVTLGQKDLDPRWCACKRHAVWWVEGLKGIIRVHDTMFPARQFGHGGKAWIIGLHNGLLMGSGLVADSHNQVTTSALVEALLLDTPDSYIFKRANSLAIRITPGYSNDTAWAEEVPVAEE
jgi:hypothetical protein